MEDYTYDLAARRPSWCSARTCSRSARRSPPGGRPARSIRSRSAAATTRSGSSSPPRRGRRSSSALVDLGDRFRLVANEVDVIAPPEALPEAAGRARASGEPQPDFATAAEAWLEAGGSHHTVFTTALGDRGDRGSRGDRRASSCVVIDEQTRTARLAQRAALEPGLLPPRRRGSECTTELRERVLAANLAIVEAGLVTLTFGNASARRPRRGRDGDQAERRLLRASSTPSRSWWSISRAATSLDGDLRPSSDAPTHLVLYRRVRRTSAASCTPTRRSRPPGLRPAARSRASARRTPTTSTGPCRSRARSA